jgi:WD40 repeat protein
VVTASSDRTIKTWNTEDGVDGSRIISVPSTAESVVFSPGGTLVATGTDNVVRICNSVTGKLIRDISTSMNGKNLTNNRTISFSENSSIMLTAGGSSSACLWSVETGKLVTSLNGHTDEVTCAVYSANGRIIATGSHDGQVILWDNHTCKPVRTFNERSGAVTDVKFSTDSKRIACVTEDGAVRIWSIANSKSFKSLKDPQGIRVVKIAFSPVGNSLVTGSRNGTMRIWDINNGKLIRTIDAFREWITSIRFSTDGSRLLASSKGTENIVRLWDWTTCSELLTLRGHSDFVNDTAISPDGTQIASAGSDNCIRIWSSSPLPGRNKKPGTSGNIARNR